VLPMTLCVITKRSESSSPDSQDFVVFQVKGLLRFLGTSVGACLSISKRRPSVSTLGLALDLFALVNWVYLSPSWSVLYISPLHHIGLLWVVDSSPYGPLGKTIARRRLQECEGWQHHNRQARVRGFTRSACLHSARGGRQCVTKGRKCDQSPPNQLSDTRRGPVWCPVRAAGERRGGGR
jgi:hypothetical protein